MATTTFNIEGMNCEHCAAHVKETLETIDGVTSAQVDLQKKNARVEHSDSVSPESLKAAIHEAGYSAEPDRS
ncbi:MAG: heavy-metal-associated domain-containing protein [Treponema sp.]|nr:heavy-metal-associated domain-containing protein [Treponema sp.]